MQSYRNADLAPGEEQGNSLMSDDDSDDDYTEGADAQRYDLDLENPRLRAYLNQAEAGRRKETSPPLLQAGMSLSRNAEPDIVSSILTNGWCTEKQWGMVAKYWGRKGKPMTYNGTSKPRPPPDNFLRKPDIPDTTAVPKPNGHDTALSMGEAAAIQRGERWMKERLDKSGLDAADINGHYRWGSTKGHYPKYKHINEDGTQAQKSIAVWVEGQIVFPLPDYDGNPTKGPAGILLEVRRLQFKEDTPFSVEKNHKYLTPIAEHMPDGIGSPIIMPPDRFKYIGTLALSIMEGFFKAFKAVKDGKFAIGISGAHGHTNGKKGLHPLILRHIDALKEEAKRQRDERAENMGVDPESLPMPEIRVEIWPDADIATNPDVNDGYSLLANRLEDLGVPISIMSLAAFGPDAKYDDVSAEVGAEEIDKQVLRIPASSLGINPRHLAQKYDLLTMTTKRHFGMPEPNIANLLKLMERHPYFLTDQDKPRLRYNKDRNQVLWGEEVMKEGVSEMEMYCYVQTKLKFYDGRTFPLDTFKQCIASTALSNSFSPMEEYLLECEREVLALSPEEQRAVDEELSNWVHLYLAAKDGDDPVLRDYYRDWARKFLITLAARQLTPKGAFTKTIFTLVGPQGQGKTWIPNLFVDDYAVIIDKRNSKDKDFYQVLGTAAVYNLDEFHILEVMSWNELKLQITQTKVTFRVPYGHAPSEHLRRGVWYASTNDDDFIPAESRGQNDRIAPLDLRHTHQGRERFPGIAMAEDRPKEWEAVRRRLLGAAVAAWRRGEEFALVEKGADYASEHVQVPPSVEWTQTVIKKPSTKDETIMKPRVGAKPGAADKVVGVKISEIIVEIKSREGPHFDPRGRSNPIADALRTLGFVNPGPNATFMGEKNVWTIGIEQFKQRFGKEHPWVRSA